MGQKAKSARKKHHRVKKNTTMLDSAVDQSADAVATQN